MNSLMDMAGRNCGNFDGDAPPAGYWLRPDTAPDRMTRLEFIDKIGQARFADVWIEMLANPLIAFAVMRGFAADFVEVTASFPSLIALENAMVLPEGTAIEIWS